MKRFEWQQRREMVTGVFVAVFVAALAALIALWLVAAVALGTIELVRRFG